MSCCGKNRQSASQPLEQRAGIPRSPTAGRSTTIPALEYTGQTALTVLGPATGRIYRFHAAGVRLRVDPRDWATLARHPALRGAGTR